MRCASACFVFAVFVLIPVSALAQEGPARPAPAVELSAGYAGFLDDAEIGHGGFGAAVRVPLNDWLSIGPELVYMRGPGDDRDLFLTGNLTVDLLTPGDAGPRRVTPFLVVGGGLMQHSDRFGGVDFSSTEGTFTAGGGVRVWLSRRVYAAAEFRVGWEPHYRTTGMVGVALWR